MDITDKAANLAHEAGNQIANATHQVAETFTEKSEQIQKAEQRLVKNCSSYIRDNPITSIGIAVAAGFLLSRVLSGR
jgi:ElaB/YqjD/DUF883 family membrane-anchored ribosome-binding protein